MRPLKFARCLAAELLFFGLIIFLMLNIAPGIAMSAGESGKPTLIAAVFVKASSAQKMDPSVLNSELGLTDSAKGGASAHSASKYLNNHTSMWNADYPNGTADYNAWLVFQLGKVYTVSGLHIWNYNESGAGGDYTDRSVKSVEIFTSEDNKEFDSLGTFTFEKATGKDDYTGQDIVFEKPAKASVFRFEIKSNYKGGDIPGLSKVRFAVTDKGAAPVPFVFKPLTPKYPRPASPKLVRGTILPGGENIVFPADAGLIDVTKAPYNAKGDGVTDDTESLQTALLDHVNQNAMIYLPNGVYLISDTLKWPAASGGKVSYGFEGIQGQSRDGTILKLKDQTFTNSNRAHAVIGMGAHGSADFFGNTIFNLTIDTGINNPGAIGMQFFSNNEGCVRDVTIQSGDGWGKIGLDLAYNDMNGPLLVKHVKVIGFDVGIETATSVNSETMEHITVENQNEAGFLNDGQCVSIHDFKSVNNGSAVVNKGSGLLTLIGAKLTGKGNAVTRPAIVNEAAMLGRGITATVYQKAIHNDGGNKLSPEGLTVAEFLSDVAVSLFPSPPHTLNLPIKETPEVAWDDLKNWANPAKFRTAADKDDTASIQAAIDSGASTIYFPRGDYKISDTILIRKNVRRLIGCRANIDVPDMPGPGFKVIEGANPTVIFERINSGYSKAVTIENSSVRTLVVRNCLNVNGNMTGAGDVFVEDVCSNPFTHWRFGKQNVWARQLNVENEGTHVENTGGKLWILGLKTERGGTLIDTKSDGLTELLGGLCYTTTAGKLAPMFAGANSSISLSIGEACFNGDPYTTIIKETRAGEAKTLLNSDPRYRGKIILYSGYGSKP